MIIDTHCHYNMPPLVEPSWQDHWKKAQETGVQASIIVGVDEASSKLGIEIAKTDPNLFASVGVHPHEISAEFIAAEQLTKILQQFEILAKDPKVVAVGETGLDYFRLIDTDIAATMQAQQESLRQHLRFAEKCHLPVIIHVRDQGEQAYWDALHCIESVQFSQRIIFHCLSGPTEYIRKAVEKGAFFGMAGNTTYPSAEHLRDLIKQIPPTQLLLETDAPFLPPKQFRGKTCEPWMISETAKFLETEIGISLPQILENTHQAFPQLVNASSGK